MKKFLKKNWTLLIVIIYFIFPDLIPGACDDISFLIVERILNTSWNRLKESKKIKNGQKERK